jgi:hypothetical protein
MPIAMSCSCGCALNIKDELGGKKIRCPACKSVLAVPVKEIDADDLMLEVLPADDPEEMPRRRESRRAAIQTEPPEVLPAREKVSSIRRRSDDEDPPVKRRPKPKPRSRPKVVFEEGWFGSLNAGVIGGVLMILIAVVWFIAGLAGGIIFFYPPILLVIGIISIAKGLSGN